MRPTGALCARVGPRKGRGCVAFRWVLSPPQRTSCSPMRDDASRFRTQCSVRTRTRQHLFLRTGHLPFRITGRFPFLRSGQLLALARQHGPRCPVSRNNCPPSRRLHPPPQSCLSSRASRLHNHPHSAMQMQPFHLNARQNLPNTLLRQFISAYQYLNSLRIPYQCATILASFFSI